MPVPSKTLLDNPSLFVSFEPRLLLLRCCWRGLHDVTTIQDDCQLVLAFVETTGCTLLLNDSSEAFGDWWQAAEWIGSVFALNLHQRGVRAAAWINAMDWPSRHAVASTLPHVQGLMVQMFDFDEQPNAYAWLQQMAKV